MSSWLMTLLMYKDCQPERQDRERQRETERNRGRQTDRQRERKRERERDREKSFPDNWKQEDSKLEKRQSKNYRFEEIMAILIISLLSSFSLKCFSTEITKRQIFTSAITLNTDFPTNIFKVIFRKKTISWNIRDWLRLELLLYFRISTKEVLTSLILVTWVKYVLKFLEKAFPFS